MMKKDEIKNPDSCLNRSLEDEYVFVLTSRDICAPLAIRAWVEARLVSGKNKSTDQQIREASVLAISMEIQREFRLSQKEKQSRPRICLKCDAPVTQLGFFTCGVGRFDLCQKEKSK